MAKQFMVEEKNIVEIQKDIYEIQSNEVKHMQVLRHNVGDTVIINNKIYEILKMTKDTIIVKYLEDAKCKKASNIEITLYMACLKNEMMDLVIKKAVEVGADKIIPFFSDNVVVKLDNDKQEKRIDKFKKIVIEAVKQCGRNDIPKVETFSKLEQIDFSENDINFFAYEKEQIKLKEKITNLKNSKHTIKKIGIIIGPEGGFTEKEAEKLKEKQNVISISLGTNILRAETAALKMISIITYEFD